MQALVEQGFNRALDAEISLFDIPEHRCDLLCRSGWVNLAARNYRQAPFRRLLCRHLPVDHQLSSYLPVTAVILAQAVAQIRSPGADR